MLLLSLLYGEGIEAQKGQVSHPRSQSSDGTRSGSQAGEFSARLLHVSTILTFGCGIIISDEVFPCVAEALEVLEMPNTYLSYIKNSGHLRFSAFIGGSVTICLVGNVLSTDPKYCII